MSKSVAGQIFDVVTCQSCESDVAFQQAAPSSRLADMPNELEITCRACGHLGSYSPTHIRQSQAQYPF